MASSWASSWASAWGSSWGSTVAPVVTATPGGPRGMRKIRRYFPIYTDEEEKPVTVVKPKLQRRIVRRAVEAFDPRTPPLPLAQRREATRVVMEQRAIPADDPALKALVEQVLLLRKEQEDEEDDEAVLLLI